MLRNDLGRLERRIQYNFKDKALLETALTHCSYSHKNNERFEFLGDSILSFVIAHALTLQFTQQTEGELSRLRAYLVKGDTLAEIAMELKLGDYIFLGEGELKSGGFRRASILADALEALIAAVFFDSDIAEAKKLILFLFASRLADNALHQNLKDAKTQLQEWLQAKKLPLPQYQLVSAVEEGADPVFDIRCVIKGLNEVTTGNAGSRRKAEQLAAGSMLLLLKDRL